VEVIIPALVLGAVVALLVLRPLRKIGDRKIGDRHLFFTDARADLEAEKESKYREIRDAELDYRMGKTSEEDWRLLDRELRAQAITILKRIDRLEER
jgi:hypothetical protein